MIIGDLTQNLQDIASNARIWKVLTLNTTPPDPLEAIEKSAVFIFTKNRGVIVGTRDKETGVIQTADVLPATLDEYEDNKRADIELSLRGSEDRFWIYIDPVLGDPQWKVIPRERIKGSEEGGEPGGALP